MRFIFILAFIPVLLAGCMPASDQSNGFHKILRPEGMPESGFYSMSMLFINSRVGFIGGFSYTPTVDSAVCMRTQNGGYSFKRYVLGEGVLSKFSSDKNSVYALVTYLSSKKDVSIIYQSDDKGKSWYQKLIIDGSIRDFHFMDSLQGVLYVWKSVYNNKSGVDEVYAYLYTTSDGGKEWRKLPLNFGDDISVLKLQDSLAILQVRYGDNILSPDSNFLIGWNYMTDKEVFRISLPRKSSFCVYDNNTLATVCGEDLLVYEITPEYLLNHLYTFDFQKKLRPQYLARYKNKIYIRMFAEMKDYIFFSSDGGRHWQERHYYDLLPLGPQSAYGEGDMLRIWLKSPMGELTMFRN